MERIISLVELWDMFEVAILVSLVGALIGHYKRNACILLPIISIDYRFDGFKELHLSSHGPIMKGVLWGFTTLKAAVLFFLFLLGFRFGENKETDPILFELGVLGDLLIGAGAGVIAKSTISLTGTENPLSVIVTSLLAGFAGLSYIQKFQQQSLDNATIEYQEKLDRTEEYGESTQHTSPSNEVAATHEKKSYKE
ncbi:hypothetical protein [Pontibacillus marinus]|uniref:Uncharacterized protein n=1 Tax=Pontibacillus marinus BH030004 = DSM 16465 TaxID=1385511 RepID=A0A0A5G6H1_9BACI|nr:hypothetical protein [Pontibacillus marinus]KGX87629.1 hypothetical protein N783_09435 [Pontibacillus marinus BH030004 = DSM 16465]